MARVGETTADGKSPRFKLLVVATQSVAPGELKAELERHARGREAQVRIVAPAIVDSALKHAAGDVDAGIRAAQARLADSAKRLAGESIEVESYAIGDSDPVLAIGDALRAEPADEVLIVTHPDEEAGWLESDVFGRAKAEFDRPMSHVSVSDDESGRVTQAVEHSDPGADPTTSPALEPPTENLPRITGRDGIGIGVAIFGTVALFAIAANCISEPADTRDVACTAQLLIAGVVALVNVAHVISLLLFSSVGYRGIAERFFARFTMLGTPAAIVAVLVIGAAS